MFEIFLIFVLFTFFVNAEQALSDEQFSQELRKQLNDTLSVIQQGEMYGNAITVIVVIICLIVLLVTIIGIHCYRNGVGADPILNIVYPWLVFVYNKIKNKMIVIFTPIYYWFKNLSVRTFREVFFGFYRLFRMIMVFFVYLLLFSALMILVVVISHFVYRYEPIPIKDYKFKNCTRSPNLSYCTYMDKNRNNYLNILYTENFTIGSLNKNQELLYINESFYLQDKKYDYKLCKQMEETCGDVADPGIYVDKMDSDIKIKFDKCPLSVHRKCYTTFMKIDVVRNDLIMNHKIFDDKYTNYLLPYTVMEYIQHLVLLVMLGVFVIIDKFDKIKIFTAVFLKHYMKKTVTKNKMKFIIDDKIKIFFKILFVVNMILMLLPVFLFIYYCCTIFAILMSLAYIFYVIYSTYNLQPIDYYVDLHKEKFSQLYTLNGGINKLFNCSKNKTHVIKELVLKNKNSIQSMYNLIFKNQNIINLNQKQIIDFIVYYGENYAYEFKKLIDSENGIIFQELTTNARPVLANFIGYDGQLDSDYTSYKNICNLYDIKNRFTVNYFHTLLIAYIKLVMVIPDNINDEVGFNISSKVKPFLKNFQNINDNYYKVFDFVTKQLKRVALFKQNDIVMHVLDNGYSKYTIVMFNVESKIVFYDSVFSRTVETVNIDEENEKVVTNVYKDKVNPIQLKKTQRIEEHSGSHALSRIEHFTIRKYGSEGSRKRILDVGSNFCGTVLAKGIVYNIANVERKDDARLIGYSERLCKYLLTNVNDSITIYFGDVTEIDFYNCDIETAYLHNCVYNIDLTDYATTHIISNFKNTITNTQIPSLLLSGMDTYDVDNEMTWTLKKNMIYNFSNCSRSKYTVCGHTENEFYEHNVSTLFDWFHIAVLNLKMDNELVGFKSNVVRKMCGYYTMQWTVSAPESETVEQVVSNVNYKPCVLIDDGVAVPREIVFFSRDTASCLHNITDSFLFNNKTSYHSNEKMLNDMCFQNVDSYKKIQNCKYRTMAKIVSEHFTKKTKMVIQMDNSKNRNKRVYTSRTTVKTHSTSTIVIGTGDKPIYHQLEILFELFADIDSRTYLDELFQRSDVLFDILEREYGKIVMKVKNIVINYIIDKDGKNNNVLYFNYKEVEGKDEFNITNRDSLYFKIWLTLQNTSKMEMKQQMDELLAGKLFKTQKIFEELNTKDTYYRDELGNIVGPYDNDTNSVIQTQETVIETGRIRDAEMLQAQEDTMELKKEAMKSNNDEESRVRSKQNQVNDHNMNGKTINIEGDIPVNIDNINLQNQNNNNNNNNNNGNGDVNDNIVNLNDNNNNDNNDFGKTRKKIQKQKEIKQDNVERQNKNNTTKISFTKMKKNNDNYLRKDQSQGKQALTDKTNNSYKTQQLLRKPMVVSEVSGHKKQFNIDDLPFNEMTISEVAQAEKTGEWVHRKYRTVALVDMDNMVAAYKGIKYDVNSGRFVNTTSIKIYKNKEDYNMNVVTEVTPGHSMQNILKTLCLVKISNEIYKVECQTLLKLLSRNNFGRVSYNFGQFD